MRVLIAAQRVAVSDVGEVGRLLGTAWADLGATVAVVPMATSGRDLQLALEPLVRVVVPPAVEDAWEASSVVWGPALRAIPAEPGPVAIDLTVRGAHDAGAGLLASLGAVADVPLDAGWRPLTDIARLDLGAVRRPGSDLVGVLAPEGADLPLCGLRGISSLRGRAAGVDPAEMLAADAALAAFAAALDVDPATPGAGAAGGAAVAVVALGGRLVTGPQLCAETVRLQASVAVADVLVTACPSLDIGNYGGPVVRYLAEVAAAAEVPLVVFSPQVAIGGRELRTLGVEAAYVLPSDPVAAAAAAARVAAGWNW